MDPKERQLQQNDGELIAGHGSIYRLKRPGRRHLGPRDPLVARTSNGDDTPAELVTVREVIGRLESYEPVRSLTAGTSLPTEGDRSVSSGVLHAELARLDESSTVLNRGLREAVLVAVKTRGMTLSEIAKRCGRFKRDARGTMSGETSGLVVVSGCRPRAGRTPPRPGYRARYSR